jgi:hypothetical protein
MNKILNLFIILTVFSVVALSAFSVIRQSLRSDTSNIKLATALVHNQFTVANADGLNNKFQISCTTILSPVQNYSVVDFLKSKHMDDSFKSRLSLAKEAGIANYHGLSGDNQRLLDYLIIKFIKENDCLPRG